MPPAPDSNPSSSSSVRRTSFNDLPTELLKRIVEFASHSRSVGMDLERATHPAAMAGSPLLAHCASGDTTAYVRWSYWHGRELEALSFVNKRLRSLAMPYLVKTITTDQLVKPCATYCLADSRTGAKSARSVHSYIAVAPLFRHLTGLTSLQLDATMVCELFQPFLGRSLPSDVKLACEFARVALEQLAHRVSRLALSGMEFKAPVYRLIAIQLIAPAQIRHTRLEGDTASLWWNDNPQDWHAFLGRLSSLDSLEIHHIGLFAELKFPKSGFARRIVFGMTLALPNIEELQLKFVEPEYDEVDEDEYMATTAPSEWPHLKTLALTLRHLRFSPKDYLDAYEKLVLNSLLPQIRRLTIYVRSDNPWTGRSWDLLEQECAVRKVDLEWRPVRWRWDEVRTRQDHYTQGWPSDTPSATYPKDALLDDLVWAVRRVDSLQQTGDLGGYKEMCAILDPLRQRRFIERGAPIVVKSEDEDEVNVRTSRF
ncbi:hypothetical protein JCM10296v2_004748 [Rhodotorula toruloides]